MAPGEIVYRGISEKDIPYILRYPRVEDLQDLLEYINTLSKEETFILFQGKQLTLEEEREWLEGMLKKIEDKRAVMLVVEINGRIAGDSDLVMLENAEAHVGRFGIGIAKEYRHQGIGKVFMEKIIDEAKKNLDDLKIIRLSVFANNPVAIKMYEEFGFKECGVLPGGLLHRDKYIDHVYMYKEV